MRLNLRQATRTMALAITLTVFGACNFAIAFQAADDSEQSPGNDKDAALAGKYVANPNYEWGIYDGREGAAKDGYRLYRLPTENDADRRAYEAGYDKGYQDNGRNGDPAAQITGPWRLSVQAPPIMERELSGEREPSGIGDSQDQKVPGQNKSFRKSLLWIFERFDWNTTGTQTQPCLSVNMMLVRPAC